ncbi:MAG: DUF3857 domain-containing protein [Bacteroidota bacterium]|nr:DUF3857 domain-containing protein [Bacteroidota bacterium]
MRSFILYLILVIAHISAFCQSNLTVALIPKHLLNKAGAVIRNSETIIEVKSVEQVIFRNKTAITILNNSGEKEANILVRYDNSRKIKYIKGNIYNEFGKPVIKFSEKDFSDVSAANDFSLYEDSRIKRLKPGLLTYPYTIEYEYEVRIKQSLSFPSWYPLNATGISIENSSLMVLYPLNFNMRFKEINFNGTKEESQQEKKIVKWQVKNIQAISVEPFSPEAESFLAIVKIAPHQFYYDGIKGSFNDWNQYGRWMNEILLKGRQELPLATVSHIKNLIKNTEDPKGKAKIIYEYMQQKTRYISVQVGIGGFQPYPATEVDRMGYGDCKGLSNYTKALLHVAGIESYYTIVNAGKFKEDISRDFASINDGNHIILCVPFHNDTIWLECTNKQNPFGYLGDFTDDRDVLVCTPEGGKLMRTPKLDNNKQFRTASFKINNQGDLSGSINTIFEGAQYDNHIRLAGESFSEQVKILSKLYPGLNLEIESLEYKQDKKELPVSTELIVLRSDNYAAISNHGMVISLNQINQSSVIPKEVRNRVNPLYINRGFTDLDEYTYEIPAGYKIDSSPKNILVEKIFGVFSAEIIVEGKNITFKRSLILKEGTYPVEQYQEFIDFNKSIKAGDDSKVNLVKTTL